MKKIFLALILIVFGAVVGVFSFSSPTRSTQEDGILKRQPIEEGVDRQSDTAASAYFKSCLPTDDRGCPIYPDTYGGCYKDDDGNFVIQVTTSDLSEYLFLQEAFPCIVFEQVKYSLNYLREIRDEYLETYDRETETVYGGGIDECNNRAYIEVDEETLSHKINDPDSPIVFELGAPWIFDLGSDDALTDNPPAFDEPDIEPVDREDRSTPVVSFAKSNQATINVKGGQQLGVYRSDGTTFGGNITAGIGCTTSSGKNGLVINGHAMKVGDFVCLDNTVIGIISFVQYNNSELGDYSIVSLFYNVTADGATYVSPNSIRYNHSVYDKLEKGDKLFKYSKNGFADFIVDDLHYKATYTINSKTVELEEMVKAKIISGVAKEGDSGAGIYHNSRDDDSTSFLEFSGIQSGIKGYDKNNPSHVIFTHPQKILNCTIVCV